MSQNGYISDWALKRFHDFKNPAYASLADLLGQSLPAERYGQMKARDLLNKIVPTTGSFKVLDVGCGGGKSAGWFSERNPEVDWSGVEIKESYNVKDPNNLPLCIKLYDGINLPFKDEEFDYCFSNQVFEHVRHPELLLSDIIRILKPKGVFFGSVSGGEMYHWHSLFNYTALGWKTILEDNGFKLLKIYSGIDALSLLLHHWSANRKDLGRYFQFSILNELLAKEPEKSPEAIRYENALKLGFAGHLVFHAEKA